MSLREYRRKRDFARTQEPPPKRSAARDHRFVIQKHRASRLHYDFRLEMEGTLKSWAVPKGIPLKHGEKRLAVQVEDHPVSYLKFEGTIPRGQYGGGTVMVWDLGTYQLSKTSKPSRGKLDVVLRGKKLQGNWHLVRMREGTGWLLIRGGPDLPALNAREEDRSVLSGKTMAQIESGRPRSEGGVASKRALRRSAPPPAFIAPMLAKPVAELPAGPGWQFEVKFDGYRALLFRQADQLHLISRNELDLSGKFPEILESARACSPDSFIMDGEIVALDSAGRSSFQLLQNAERETERPAVFYYAFDLIRLARQDLQKRPLEERRALLEPLVASAAGGWIRFSPAFTNSTRVLLSQIRELGLEGLIGKRVGSRYESGRRTGAWIKFKVQQEGDFVIGGFTPPGGSRQHLGALLLGFFENQVLRFAGKVGTGFTEKSLKSLHERLDPLTQSACPFADLPEQSRGRFGSGLTRSAMKDCHWVDPTLVCRIRYTERTRDGKLRHPVFLGLRPDLDAKTITGTATGLPALKSATPRGKSRGSLE